MSFFILCVSFVHKYYCTAPHLKMNDDQKKITSYYLKKSFKKVHAAMKVLTK